MRKLWVVVLVVLMAASASTSAIAGFHIRLTLSDVVRHLVIDPICAVCGGVDINKIPLLGPIAVETEGDALEAWIKLSYSTASRGAKTIPDKIRQQLTGYATEQSMDKVRFKVEDNGFANLAHVIEQRGKFDAVTLDNVIVFRGPSEADDPSIWAHELFHVQQYSDMGLHSFAVRYAKNYHDLEDPAYAQGEGYWAWAEKEGIKPNPDVLHVPMVSTTTMVLHSSTDHLTKEANVGINYPYLWQGVRGGLFRPAKIYSDWRISLACSSANCTAGAKVVLKFNVWSRWTHTDPSDGLILVFYSGTEVVGVTRVGWRDLKLSPTDYCAAQVSAVATRSISPSTYNQATDVLVVADSADFRLCTAKGDNPEPMSPVGKYFGNWHP